MKKFKFMSLLTEAGRPFYSYKGRNVFDLNHAMVRFKERFPNLSKATYMRVLEDGIDIILDVFKDSSAKYIVVSKSTRLAIQLDWRKNERDKSGVNQGFTATTLDADKHQKEMKMDTKIFVEEIEKNNLKSCFKESMTMEQVLNEIGYIDIKLPECDDYKIYLHEGKVCRNFDIVEVA